MADQGKWFKLWVSALSDAALEDLNPHEWYCWARLGAYIKAHGIDGTITFVSPAYALTSLFRVETFGAAIAMIRRFPNCVIEEGKSSVSSSCFTIVSIKVNYQNWLKYQGDYSTGRVRKFRQRKRQSETPQEEKRGEETKSPSPKGSPSNGTGRSAPPDAPAPRPSARVENDERRDYGHEDFLAQGHRNSQVPRDSFSWTHLEQTMTNVERVQSKMREKLYSERKSAKPVTVPEEDQF